jgi:hypothetical protein
MASTIQVDKVQDTGGNTILSSNSTGTFTYEAASGANFTALDADNVSAGTLAIARGGTGAATLAAAGLANTPAFAVGKSAVQTISSSAATKVTFDTEYLDSDSAFASDKFTCPSGGAGKYLMAMKTHFSGNANLVKSYTLIPYKNGAAIDYGNTQSATTSGLSLTTTYTAAVAASSTFIVTLAETDYVECYVTIVTADASDPQITNYYTSWGGYRLIGV